jgi:hypothetical protein
VEEGLQMASDRRSTRPIAFKSRGCAINGMVSVLPAGPFFLQVALEFVAKLSEVVKPARHARLFAGAEDRGERFRPLRHAAQMFL